MSEAERRLRGIVALAADAIISTDETFRITLFNPAAERIFGYSRAEVLGQPLDCLLPENAREAHRAHLAHFSRTPVDSKEMSERGRVWGRRKSGELFPAEASVSKLRIGDATHFTAVLRDVSQQRRAEKEREALLAAERLARTAAEAAERRMTFLANASEILHSSLAYEETFEALLHLIVPELAQFCTIDVVEESSRVRRTHAVHADPDKQSLIDRLRTYPREQTRYLSRRALHTGEAELVIRVTDEFLHTIASNDEHLEILRALEPSSFAVVPLRSHQRVLGALVLARGPGATPYTQQDLAFAQELAHRAASALTNARLYDQMRRAVRAREDVLSVVSHDLRSPLSVIAMCASSLLAEGFGDEARDRDAVQTIQQSTHWAQRLIQDLLDVSAIEAGGLSLTRRLEDPVMLVTRAVLLHEELAAERAISLVTELPERTSLVNVDADRIVQALGNLIGNALKFTPHRGSIRIGAVDETDQVRFYVADDGPGIPADHIPHIFDRFWTARRDARTRGTGMGLAIVRGIVEAHGGRVWLEPARVGGATFSIALPSVAASPA